MQLRNFVKQFFLWYRAIMPNYVLCNIYLRFTLHRLRLIAHVHGNAFKFQPLG
jgi:hypothetical protein